MLEVPAVMLPAMSPPHTEQLGLAHVTLDLTPISVSLRDSLNLLQHRSLAQFSRSVHVILPLHQQMLGPLVVEATVVRAPDGMQLRLMRRLAALTQDLAPDWMS